MPYKFNNSANQYSLEYDNPILRTEISTGISDMVKKYSQPLSRYPIKIDNNNFKINTPYQESINQQSQPKKATTFAEGFDAWKQNFINNMNYIGSSIEKEASGDNYIKSAVNSLQNSYNGDLLAQPNDVLRSKIKEIEKGLYQVPFPSMSPTHALSLQQPLKMEEIVKKNIMNDIITKRESGYDDAQIADWLENLYDNGTEASARHREVLKEAENIIANNFDETRAIGAEQLCKMLRGEISEKEAVEKWTTKTNQYAKRQKTWFRGQYKADFVINHVPNDADIKTAIDKIV